jgi:cyclophilin family peptidyl-prolyl cis-trans isomerase
MKSFLVTLAFGCVLLFGLSQVVLAQAAQDTTAKDDSPALTEAQSADFATLLAQWNELDKQLKEKAAAYASADVAVKADLKREYVDLVAKAKTQAIGLRAAAISTYKASPNTDEVVNKLLIGMIIQDIRDGNKSAAFELARLLMESKADQKYFVALRDSGRRVSFTDIPFIEELILRSQESAADDLPRVKLVTNKGEIEIELFENEAPETVGNFVSLVEKGFYTNLTFHRVLEAFVAQGGDPEGNGTGGPGYNIYCEVDNANARRHHDGYISMAHSGKNTGGSQFFIVLDSDNAAQLDGKHTVFGCVIKGMDVVKSLQLIDPEKPNPAIKADVITKAEIIRKRNHEYAPRKVE